MDSITIKAHYDGRHILPDQPLSLPPNTPLEVTVRPAGDVERQEWANLAAQMLARAYGKDEPEYSLADIQEVPGGQR